MNMPIPLKTIDTLPRDRPVFIYGSSLGGRRIQRALSVVGRMEIAGFVDTFKSGTLAGLPILSLEEFRKLDHAGITLIIASSFFKPIHEAIAPLPLAACFDARPILRAFPANMADDDLTMDDESFRAFFEWRMRETDLQRALYDSDAPFPVRVKYDAVARPYYALPMLDAARLCHALGMSELSAIEFGVAGGNGLVLMEEYAAEIEKIVPVKFSIFGFDTGAGLPPSDDHRDMVYQWRPGDYGMDQDALRARLTRSTLVLGDIGENLDTFFETYRPPPLGCCFVDVDYYSSTVKTLKCFEKESRHYLPRIACYFDDIVNEFAGELLAIREFNDRHTDRKFSVDRQQIRYRHVIPAPWQEAIYDFHAYGHPQYNTPLSLAPTHLPLI